MRTKYITPKSGYIYRIRNRKAPNLLLELKDGMAYRITDWNCWLSISRIVHRWHAGSVLERHGHQRVLLQTALASDGKRLP